MAVTDYLPHDGRTVWAEIKFDSDKDFRDASVSQGWLSLDFKTVTMHETGHAVGICDHAKTANSPMAAKIAPNTAYPTINSHNIATIGGMH